MNLSQLRSRCKPHLWFQLYWVVYLVWFFWLDLYPSFCSSRTSECRKIFYHQCLYRGGP